MTLPSDPREFLGEIYDSEFGFRPTNMSIKPVHVANGLSRELIGITYKADALTDTLRQWVRNQRLGIDEERHSNQSILDSYPTAFHVSEGASAQTRQLNSLRALMKDTLGADGAVYDGPDVSSFTLSNESFVTRDPSDVRMGLFLARMLRTPGAGEDDAAALFMELLEADTDAWSTLALPLLGLGSTRPAETGTEAQRREDLSAHLFRVDDGSFVSPTLARLRAAMNRLARYERQSSSKLNSLRRIVLFGCFAIHVFAIGRWSERDPSAPRPPIFLDMFDGTNLSIRNASRATLRSAGDAIEGMVLSSLRDRIHQLGHSDESLSTSSSWQAGLPTVLLDSYNSYHEAGLTPGNAMAQAYFDVGMTREHPIGAFVELGRRAGYLTPWSNNGRGGKLSKRYSATAEFLETLVAATIDRENPVEFADFLTGLRETFGIVVGTQADESAIRSNNLYDGQFGTTTPINEEDLRANTARLRDALLESGLARAYADGRTIVTNRVGIA